MDSFLNAILECLAPGDNYADAYRTVSVKTVEVLQIPIEERILVVPFYFEGDSAVLEFLDVIDLMRMREGRLVVDLFLNPEYPFSPALIMKSLA